MINKFSRRLTLAWQALRTGGVNEAAAERAIRPLTPGEIAEAQSFFPLPKFFVYGHGRSGTTLLMRLIRLHPQVHCNRQAHFFTRPPYLHSLVSDPKVAEWLARPSNRWNRGEDLSPVVMRAVSDYILERDARQAGKTIVGDKSPNDYVGAEGVSLTHRFYPDAKIIFIVRDGRDAALSRRVQSFIDSIQQLKPEDLRIREAVLANPDRFQNGSDSIFSERWIREAAVSWNENVRETPRVAQELYKDCFLSLKYEDMLENPARELMRIWKFLEADVTLPGLEDLVRGEMEKNPDAKWQRSQAAELLAVLPKGGPGTWRKFFTPRDRQIFRAEANEMLAAWKYEQNGEW